MTSRSQPDEQGVELPPILSPFLLSDNTILPPIEPNISRPPSTSSQSSSHYVQPRPSPRIALQLPGLSQLAAMASSSPASRRGSLDSIDTSRASQLQFRSNLPPQSMTSTAVATAGLGGSVPVCQNCATSTTPMWRRDEHGTVLCNACGLFLKLHGRPRPISLKTDTIKSRNRVRVPGEAPEARRRSANAQAVGESSQASSSKSAKRARISQQTAAAALHRSQSPLSRSITSGNIAPQSIFDSIAHDSQAASGSASAPFSESAIRQASPLRLEENANPVLADRRLSYESLLKEATNMQTRINELDVINVLFRGRVEELETSQQEARTNESTARDAERTALAALDSAKDQLTGMRQRIQELEDQLARRKS